MTWKQQSKKNAFAPSTTCCGLNPRSSGPLLVMYLHIEPLLGGIHPLIRPTSNSWSAFLLLSGKAISRDEDNLWYFADSCLLRLRTLGATKQKRRERDRPNRTAAADPRSAPQRTRFRANRITRNREKNVLTCRKLNKVTDNIVAVVSKRLVIIEIILLVMAVSNVFSTPNVVVGR